MKLHVALPDRMLVTTPRARVPVRKLTARRDDRVTIDVTFSTNGRPGPLPAGSTVALVAYAGPGVRTPLVYATTFNVVGRGTSVIYRFPFVDFAVPSLGTAFATKDTIPLSFEVRVTSSGGGISYSTAPVTLEINQSAFVAGATPPASLDVPTTPLYLREIDALVGGDANHLDSVPTYNRAGLLVMCYIDSQMQTWRLFPGTDVSAPSGGIVRPVDYDEVTNAYVWKRIA